MLHYLFLVFLGLTVISCHKLEQGKTLEREKMNVRTGMIQNDVRIPPGKCRFIGTIEEIHDNQLSDNKDDPCSKVPCLATVRIDSVLGYGQGVLRPLAKGERIQVQFKFTLQPSATYFPRLKTVLPGLHLHNTFLADLNMQELIDSPKIKQAIHYSILTYSIVE